LAASAVGGDMRFFSKLVVAILILVAAVVLADYLGTYDATYECSGVMAKASNKSDPITLFIKTRGGMVCALEPPLPPLTWTAGEIPSTTGTFRTDYFYFKREPLYLNVYRWPNNMERTDDWMKVGQRGQCSLISNSLILNISDEETFRGACAPKNN